MSCRNDLNDIEIKECELLYSDSRSFGKTTFEHKNIWDFTYSLIADGVYNERIWLKTFDSRYLRCTKPRMLNLRLVIDGVEKPIKKFRGQPEMIEKEQIENGDIAFQGRLYFVEREFKTLEELQFDFNENRNNADYTRFFNDVFGNS